MPTPPRTRTRDEHGVVAVVIAILTCFTLIPLAAYAVDIGVQRVARRDVQAIADVIALDLSHALNGSTWAQLHDNMQTLANKSLARNGSTGTGMAVTAQLGKVTPSAYNPATPNSYFTPINDNASGIPTAVLVTVSTTVGFAIHGGTGSVTRTAIGQSQSLACFKLGSFALSLNSGNSALLNSMIGDALNLGVLSYDGLADANITLLGLATELNVASPDQLMSTTVSLNQLYLAAAQALSKQGGSVADVALLNQLATANFGGLPNISLGNVFSLASGQDAALATSLNLLDLVATTAFIANGQNAIAVPSLTVGIPSVAGISTSLKVIQAPERACGNAGQATVTTSQVKLDVIVTLANIDILGLAASTQVTLHVDLAQATGLLTQIVCGNPEGINVSVASALSMLSSTVSIDLKLLGLTIVHIDGTAGTTAPAATNSVQFRIPTDSYSTPKSTGSGVILPTVAIGNLNATVLGILPLGLSVGSILSAVVSSILTPIVNPLIANVNNLVLVPVTDLLGINVAGADVFAIPHPVCNAVSLAG